MFIYFGAAAQAGSKRLALLRRWLALIVAVAPVVAEAKTILGIGIAKSDDVVYTWFADGVFTKGSSSDLQKYRIAYPYTPPDHPATTSIVAMSIGKDDHVFTWYSDQTVSEGNSGQLAIHRARAPVTLPGKKTMADVVGIGIAGSDGRVYSWYRDQTVCVGKPDDLSCQNPVHFDLPDNPLDPGTPMTTADIVEIDIAKNDHVYTWYANGFHSEGNSSHLGRYNFGGYVKSAVLHNFWKPTGGKFVIPHGIPPDEEHAFGEKPAPHKYRGPGPSPQPISTRKLNTGITSQQKVSYAGSLDAMVAVGRRFIAMTDTTSVAFRDRAGKVLVSKDTRFAGGFNTADFFSAFIDGKDPNIDVNLNTGFAMPCASKAQGNGCLGTDFYDTRVVYDPVSQRFFITAQVRNAITTLMNGMSLSNTNNQYDHPWACAYWKDPTVIDPSTNKPLKHFTKDQDICLMSRHLKALAVSVSEDPREGFHQYIYTGTTEADWPWVAVNGSRVVLSNWGDVSEPPAWPARQPVALVFNLPDVASGVLHPAFLAYFPKDLNGLKAVQAPTHHGETQGLTFLVHGRGSALAIFGIPDNPNPWLTPALLGTQEFGLSHDAPSAVGAVYRNGKLYFVDSTGEDKCVGASYMGPNLRNDVRLVVVPVKRDGQKLTSSDSTSDGFVDLTFTPGDGGLSYDNPSIDVNRNGGIMFGYHLEPFSHVINPSAGGTLLQAWPLAGAEIVVQPGVPKCTLVQVASGQLKVCRLTNDFTTTVVDPVDDLGYWTALPFWGTDSNGNGAVLTSINYIKVPPAF